MQDQDQSGSWLQSELQNQQPIQQPIQHPIQQPIQQPIQHPIQQNLPIEVEGQRKGHLKRLACAVRTLSTTISGNIKQVQELDGLYQRISQENHSVSELLNIYSETALVSTSLINETLAHGSISEILEAEAEAISQLDQDTRLDDTTVDSLLAFVRPSLRHVHRSIRRGALCLLRALIPLNHQMSRMSKDQDWIRDALLNACSDQHDSVCTEAIRNLSVAHDSHGLFLDDYLQACAQLVIKVPGSITKDIEVNIRKSKPVFLYAVDLYQQIFSEAGLEDITIEARILLARGILLMLPDLAKEDKLATGILKWMILLFLETLGSMLTSESVGLLFQDALPAKSLVDQNSQCREFWDVFAALVEKQGQSSSRDSTFATLMKSDAVFHELFEECATALKIPVGFSTEFGSTQDSATQFVAVVPSVLAVLRWLFGSYIYEHVPRIQMTDAMVCRIVITCSSFMAKPISPWSSKESQHTAGCIIECMAALCKKDTVQAFISHHVESILIDYIKPLFSHASVDEKGNRAKPKSNLLQLDDSDRFFGKRQPWKENHVASVVVLEYCCLQLQPPLISKVQHLLFPPILTLLDDHEACYKLCGVRLAKHCFVVESFQADLRRTGLGSVLFDALSVCTLYMAEYELMDEAFETIRMLVPRLHTTDSTEFVTTIDTHLRERVVARFTFAVGAQVKALRVLFRESCQLIALCPILVFKYLKVLLELALEVLQINQRDTVTQIAAADTLLFLIEFGWARIPSYQGLVMKSVAEAWRLLHLDVMISNIDKASVSELNSKLRYVVKMMCECTSGKAEMDMQVLLLIDSELFGPLAPSEMTTSTVADCVK
ncbi:hypothetical protein BASA60_007424 [Batrachochytrium salamandrivorans]|nr:hypothetical protein BASA60_007424 [Batrachochytrium salamandrivorans]